MAFDAFALIIVMLGIGMVLGRLGMLDAAGAEALNKVVLYVCLPAAVLRYAPQLTLEPALLGVIAVPWLLLVPVVPLIVWLGRKLVWRRDQVAALLARQPGLIVTIPSRLAALLRDSTQVAIVPPPFEIPPFELKMAWSPLLQNNPAHRWMRRRIQQVARGGTD